MKFLPAGWKPPAARPGRRGIAGLVLAGVTLGAVTGLAVSSCGGPARPPGAAGHRPGPGAPGPDRLPAGVTRLAMTRGGVPGYASPGGRRTQTLPAAWHARPLALPVIADEPGWVRVRVPWRPNGSTTWLRAGDVSPGSTPYRIVIDTAAARLDLYDRGHLVFSAPAGVGAPDDPTPPGHYFAAFDEVPPQSDSGYGAFIMVTSAHSKDIADWEGSGDAIIGIHGPLGADREIGRTGARISHGCVRLHLDALSRLANVPPGTPIDITQ